MTRIDLTASGAEFDRERRRFLQTAGLATAGFALLGRVAVPAAADAAEPAASPAGGVPAATFSAFLSITLDGEVRIVCPQAEIGQGVHDGLSRILAEELDADWSRVTVVQAHADKALASPVSKRQRIGGSDSVMAYHDVLRSTGAAAREMLVGAAAARWGVPAAECVTEAGRVRHAASGRQAAYGELAADAARLTPPQSPRLKAPAEYRLRGRRLTRKDTPAKADGSALFAPDLREPGLLHAALRRSTSVAGRLRRFDAASVASRPGVVSVVPLDDAVAVVADSWWRAKSAADALDVEFEEAHLRGLSSESIAASLRRALGDDAAAKPLPLLDYSTSPPKRVPTPREALDAAFATAGARLLEADYFVPYEAHMTMEPQSCVARVTADRCEVRGALQQPDFAKNLAVQMTGLPPEHVHVEVVYGGGGFGRRWELDSLRQVLTIAKTLPGRAVSLLWTREQDTQHDFYRAAYMARYRAAVDRSGRVLAVHGRISGQSLLGFKGMRQFMPGGVDGTVVFGVVADEYAFGQRLADWVEVALPVPIGFWRSVSGSQNGFFSECFVDELAHAAGRDPLAFRRETLAGHPRLLAVLERAAKEAGWGTALPRGAGRGIAVQSGYGGFCAQVAQVAVRGKRVVVERIVCAYDCGPVVDPGVVEAQLEGGIVWGLSAALNGGVTFTAGAAVQTNFHERPILRIDETPRIDVHLVPGDGKIGGVGESGVPPVAPAVANAIFAATGQRLRSLPLRPDGLEIGGRA